MPRKPTSDSNWVSFPKSPSTPRADSHSAVRSRRLSSAKRRASARSSSSSAPLAGGSCSAVLVTFILLISITCPCGHSPGLVGLSPRFACRRSRFAWTAERPLGDPDLAAWAEQDVLHGPELPSVERCAGVPGGGAAAAHVRAQIPVAERDVVGAGAPQLPGRDR